MSRYILLTGALLASLLLTGCIEGPRQDLVEARLSELRERPRGRIEPLPEFNEPVRAEYTQQGQRDPFAPPQRLLQQMTVPPGLPAPDLSRPRTPLESWELDQLSYRGSMRRGQDVRALILTPDQQLISVRQGDRMGQNHGTISQITGSSITLRELIADGSGQWREREQTIHLSR